MNDQVLLITRSNEIRGVDLLQPYYHIIPTIRLPNLLPMGHLDYWATNGTLFWIDQQMNEVKISGLTTSSMQTLIDTGIDNPSAIAVDWFAKLLYVGWSNGITVYNLEGEYPVTLIEGVQVLGLAINPTEGTLFWLSSNETNSTIEMSFMDGSERDLLLELSYKAEGLTIDIGSNRLYWIGNYGVNYYDFTKKSIHNVNLTDNAKVSAIAIYKDLIYYADEFDQTIHFADKTLGLNNSVLRNSSNVLNLRVYDPSEQRGSSACVKANNPCQHLCLPRSKETATCRCAVGYILDTDNKTCIGNAEFLLYYRGELSGISLTDPKSLNVLAPISRIHMASAIDFVFEKDLIFWLDSELGTISKIMRDGSKRTTIIHHEGVDIISGDWLSGLAVDWSAENVYWGDPKHGVIEVAKFDGSSRYIILFRDIGKVSSMALDPEMGVLVWAGDFGHRLEAAGLDGSNRKLLVDNVLTITDVTMDYDSKTIYWCDSEMRLIQKINYDGKGSEILLSESLVNPVALTVFDDYLYWGDT